MPAAPPSPSLSKTQTGLLLAMARGAALKAHRDVDGAKVFQLHTLAGADVTVRRATVEALTAQGLIDSNKKFPAATYWLTEAGRACAAALATPPTS